jgi:hypothetical protein
MRSTSRGTRQSVGFDAFWIEEDLHRYTLDDLNEIAGGVVRWKGGRNSSRCLVADGQPGP